MWTIQNHMLQISKKDKGRRTLKEILQEYCRSGTGRTRYPVAREQVKWTWGNHRKKCTVGKSPVTLMNVVLRVLGNILWWDAVWALAHKVMSTGKKSDDVKMWEPVQQGHRKKMVESQEQFVPTLQDVRQKKRFTGSFAFLLLKVRSSTHLKIFLDK